MAKINNFFKFTGTLKLLADGKSLRTIDSKKNPKWHGKELVISIGTEEGSQLVRLFGGSSEDDKTVETLSKNKDEKNKYIKLSIPLARKDDKDVLDSVASFKKIKIMGSEFLREIDAIDFAFDNLPTDRVTVTGKVEFDVYNGKIFPKFYFNEIRKAGDDEKEGFGGSLPIYVTENTFSEDYLKGKGVDYTLIEKERKIPLTVYVEQYNKDKVTKEEKPVLYLPITVFVTVSEKFDFSRPEHMKRLKFKLETLLVKKGIHEIGWDVRYFKGAEKTEITMDDLTTFEKLQIENGMKTFDEIVAGKQGRGEFKEEIQLIKFHANYSDGLIEAPITEDDLEDLFYTSEEVTVVAENPTVALDDEDLF